MFHAVHNLAGVEKRSHRQESRKMKQVEGEMNRRDKQQIKRGD